MKIAAGWCYWVAYQLLSLVLIPVGAVVILPFAIARAWRREFNTFMGIFHDVKVWKGGWLTCAWNNLEDGVCPRWYGVANPHRPMWLNAYIWSVFRNGANGLRLLPGATFKVDPRQVVSSADVSTQGWRQCRRITIGRMVFRLGWLINGPPFNPGTPYWAWPVFERLL